jgi:hypothetical protein
VWDKNKRNKPDELNGFLDLEFNHNGKVRGNIVPVIGREGT